MSRSKNKSLSPVKVVVFLLGVVFVGAANIRALVF